MTDRDPPEAASARGVRRTDDMHRRMIEDAGIGISETALDGSFLYINRTLALMMGHDTVEGMFAANRKASDYYVDPGFRPNLLEKVEREGQVRNVVCAVRRVDGVRIWVSENSTANRDENGRIVGYFTTITDVTELVETQARLEQAEADYRRIFERATIGIYRSSLDGRQLRANPALVRLNGYETEEQQLNSVVDIGQEWYVDPTRRDEFSRLLHENGYVENFESEIYRHNTRERIWISENAYLVRDANGTPLFYEGTVREITEQRNSRRDLERAKEEAEAANRAKTRFLANMSHELRTPLNSVIGYTDLILMEVYGELKAPKYKEYLQDIRSSALMLLQLIDDVLDIARVGAGKLPISFEELRLDEIIHDTLTMLGPKAGEAQLEIVQEIAPDLPTVPGDPRRMRQVLVNLVSNAVKYTEAGGKITISAARQDDWAEIRVQDTGVGIAADDLDRVFRPFEQTRYAIGKAKDGAGLGLPLTRELVQEHNGEIFIDSEEGKGTTVTVRLPVFQREGASPTA